MTLKITGCLLCSGGGYPHYGGGRVLRNVGTFQKIVLHLNLFFFSSVFISLFVFECWPSTVAQTQMVTTVLRRTIYLSDKQLACLTVLRSSIAILCPDKRLHSSQNHFLVRSAALPLTRILIIQCSIVWAATEIIVTQQQAPRRRALLEKLSSSSNQGIPRILRKPFITVVTTARTCPSHEPDQFNPCTPFHFMKIHFNIILPSTPRPSTWSLSHTVVKEVIDRQINK